MKPGPKGVVTVGPLDLTMLPTRRDWRRVDAFCTEFLTVPRGHGAMQPFRLRPWQRDIVKGLYPARGPRPRSGLVSIPRGNGKSTLAAALGLYALYADGEEGAEVLVVASDERQARIVWNGARRMIELDDRLLERTHIYKDRIEFPERDGTFAPLPAEPDALQGWAPSMVVVDELHVVNEEVWEAMSLAAGKRATSLAVAISTPAGDKDSIMFKLVDHGRAGKDKSFYFTEYAAPDGCDLDDETAWATANPALGDFLAIDALRANLKTTREDAFRRYRLGQWVGRATAWLPYGSWESLDVIPGRPADGTRVVLGFDGSTSGDATALMGVVPGPVPHVFTVGLWESDGPSWRVPRHDVASRVEEAFTRWDVVELVADPWGWQSELEAWEVRYGTRRIISFNTANRGAMGPACDRLAAAVLQGHLTTDGDDRVATHVANAVPIETAHGAVITKDKRGSSRKIDAAVATILAFERAAEVKARPKLVVFAG